jgi:Zn-dependent peptidase ImmA (M78 family)
MARSLKDGAQERKLLANNAYRSSEQQADAFARFFLVPRHIAERLGTIDRIMSECRVTFDVARDVMRHYGMKLSRRLLPYEVQAQLDCDEDDLL